MVKRSIPITEARSQLSRLPEELGYEEAPEAIAITRRGRPVLAVLPWDFYDGLVETLDILSDEQLMAALRQSLKEMEKGKLIPWDEVKSDL
jgi:antitoxin YefM